MRALYSRTEDQSPNLFVVVQGEIPDAINVHMPEDLED